MGVVGLGDGTLSLSILVETVLLPERNDADADLENAEEDGCGCFGGHCVFVKSIFEVHCILRCRVTWDDTV